LSVAEIDFVCRAPDGKEVEEITKKEIHKALRSRVTAEQAKLELGVDETGAMKEQPERLRQSLRVTAPSRSLPNRPQRYARPPLEGSRPPLSRQDGPSLTPEEKSVFKSVMDDLFGTHGACIFDQNLNILGKVPLSELSSTVQSLNGGVYAIALDGTVDPDLVRLAEKVGVTHVLGTGSTVKEMSKVRVLTDESL